MTAYWLVGYLVPPLIGEVRKGLLTSQLSTCLKGLWAIKKYGVVGTRRQIILYLCNRNKHILKESFYQ